MNLERLWDILLRKTDFGRTTEVERSIAANCHSTFVWPFFIVLLNLLLGLTSLQGCYWSFSLQWKVRQSTMQIKGKLLKKCGFWKHFLHKTNLTWVCTKTQCLSVISEHLILVIKLTWQWKCTTLLTKLPKVISNFTAVG